MVRVHRVAIQRQHEPVGPGLEDMIVVTKKSTITTWVLDGGHMVVRRCDLQRARSMDI